MSTLAAHPSDTSRHPAPRISYRIRNERPNDPPRIVDVDATAVELEHLRIEGYLVRERLISGDLLARLRGAADEVEATERPKVASVEGMGFGGLFIRNLFDRHPAFMELLDFAPTLSVARAVLGPQVQVHASVLRVSYPTARNQAVQWHFHQRVVPDPIPAFFYRPCVLDNLIYLDDITPDSGPFVALPRTHLLDDAVAAGDYADKPGQVVVTCPAGSCVTAHGALWHRAMAPTPQGTKRRLLILAYSPCWIKPVDRTAAFDGRAGFTTDRAKDANDEMRELLGLTGHL